MFQDLSSILLFIKSCLATHSFSCNNIPLSSTICPYQAVVDRGVFPLITVGMAKSLIQNVTEDHLVIKTLYAMFRDEDNTVQRQKIANTIIRELTVHSVTEEIVLYCSVDKYIPDRKMIVGEAREEHFAIQNEIFQLDNMKVTDPNYGEKLDNTIRKFNKHACQEEVNILPKLKETLSVEQMNKLARQWEKDRALVPTRPHPGFPNNPLIETIASVATNPFDQARDINREYVEIDRNNL